MGEKIKELRKTRGVSQWGVAAATGVSATVISAIEKYGLRPGPYTRLRLSEYFGVPESELWPQVTATDAGEAAQAQGREG